MGNLTVDPLALAALGGFGTLILIFGGLTYWFMKQAGKASGEK